MVDWGIEFLILSNMSTHISRKSVQRSTWKAAHRGPLTIVNYNVCMSRINMMTEIQTIEGG